MIRSVLQIADKISTVTQIPIAQFISVQMHYISIEGSNVKTILLETPFDVGANVVVT